MSKWLSALGDKVALLYLLLVILIFLDVTMRYTFNFTQVWISEIEWQLFAFLFLIGMGHTLIADKHVRVDLFYANFSPRRKSSIDGIGNLLFLVPWCAVIIVTSYKYAMNSWYIRESSVNPNGLPARYIIKFFIVIAFVLLLFAGISQSVQKIKSLFIPQNT